MYIFKKFKILFLFFFYFFSNTWLLKIYNCFRQQKLIVICTRKTSERFDLGWTCLSLSRVEKKVKKCTYNFCLLPISFNHGDLPMTVLSTFIADIWMRIYIFVKRLMVNDKFLTKIEEYISIQHSISVFNVAFDEWPCFRNASNCPYLLT